MIRFCRVALALVLVTSVLQNTAAAQDNDWRTIEFETTEVTEADVALSPDGQWLIYTMVGHLFRLPVEAGTAEQLTFGPYYDSDPVFSPDGNRVAFVSDRDGSEGNVFVLGLADGQITQVTHEPWAGRPAWSPDGQAIVYLGFVREAFVGRTWRSVPALIRRVSLTAGEPETLSTPPRLIRSVFYLPDGRLAWAIVGRAPGSRDFLTRIEVMSAEGTVSTLRTVACYGDRVVASPMGDGLYCHCSDFAPGSEGLRHVPLPEGAERQVLPPVSARSGFAPRGPLFAVAADNKSLYLGEAGRLWKITLPSGDRELVAFRAQLKLEIREQTPPPRTALTTGRSVPPRSIVSPRLSPDGRTLVFVALGYLWQQPLDGGPTPRTTGPAQRLFEGAAFEDWPAFSPDGQQLAFVHSEHGKPEIRVFDFETGQTRTVASGWWQPSWSRDGQRLVFWESGVVTVNLGDGTTKERVTENPSSTTSVSIRRPSSGPT